jgi:outer membrane protein assembly factor BamE (lipoprotein component of BamABCDE complex)
MLIINIIFNIGGKMKKSKGFIVLSLMLAMVFVVATSLSGCASAGNESISNQSNQKLSQKIIPGQTTESQIKQMFGDPEKTTFNGKGELMWTYIYKHGHRTVGSYIPVVDWFVDQYKGHDKTLVVLFHKDKIVKNYSFSSSAIAAHVGL